MKICNCHKDLHAYLCDIPFEWRDPIVKALCLILSEQPSECQGVSDCETLTFLYSFSINGNILSIQFKDEDGQLTTSSIDITTALNDVLDDVDPKCIMSVEAWQALSFEEKLQAIIDAQCDCCGTTTTSTTTTTTAQEYDYYYANAYSCLDGDCQLVAEEVLIYLPTGTIYSPSYFYQGVDYPNLYYQIVSPAPWNIDAVTINTAVFSSDCGSFCPDTTTTTTTSSTTTTTTGTTTTTSTTTTTTAAPPCECNTYEVENTTAAPLQFTYIKCEDIERNVLLGAFTSTIVCACEENITVPDGVTVTLLEAGCAEITTTTTTSTTTTTTEEPTTTTTTTSTTTTSSTTTTTTEAPLVCYRYQIQGTPSGSFQWQDCDTETLFSTTLSAGNSIIICAVENTVELTGGSGSITNLGDCNETTTTSTTTTTTEEPTTTSTTTTTTEEPTTTSTTTTTTDGGEYVYYFATQYTACVQSSSPGQYILRVPVALDSGTWWCGDDGFQYEFSSSTSGPTFDITATANASPSNCVNLPC